MVVVSSGVRNFDSVQMIPASLRKTVDARLQTARSNALHDLDPVDAELVYEGGVMLSPRLAERETSTVTVCPSLFRVQIDPRYAHFAMITACYCMPY
jgi:hypothetical protein